MDINLDEARRKFVNRANNFIIADILSDQIGTQIIHKYLCSKLGERWTGLGCLHHALGDDFYKHIQALEALYENPRTRNDTDQAIARILGESEIDIRIRWSHGHFLPSGAPLLDEKLVNDVLRLVDTKKYEGVLLPFRKGLDHLINSAKRPEILADVITDMYEALEALAKVITARDRNLSGNAELFISKLNVSQEYKTILKAYIAYANEFRHAAEEGRRRATLSPSRS